MQEEETLVSLGDLQDTNPVHRNQYLEKLSRNVRVRRKAINKAIKQSSFAQVFEELRDLEEEKTGYKVRRIREDLNWLKTSARKGRYGKVTIPEQQ